MLFKVQALLAVAVIVGSVTWHGGGTDSFGCHYDRKTGFYHCH